MKHILLILMILSLIPAGAMGETNITFAPDLTGQYVYPEGASEADALYIYRYCYPQLTPDTPAAELINSTYLYTAEDAVGFEAPMLASGMQEGDAQKVVELSYEITCVTADYLSVRVVKRVRTGDHLACVTTGHVFALTGESAGELVSLPYFLDLLDPDDMDEWYRERQRQKADRCVRDMVWARLEEMNARGEITLYADLTFEEFEAGFYPEEDFYLDENGDPAFYLMAGSVADPEAGEVIVVLPLDELLDEL